LRQEDAERLKDWLVIIPENSFNPIPGEYAERLE
jgi:hypothetical protein